MYGLLIPNEGTILYNHRNIENCRNEFLHDIGIITTDDRTLYYKLTARENLYYIGRIMGIEKKILNERITKYLTMFDIADDKKLVEDFSTGMKKKILIARALINNPKIIFADEPFNGLDVETVKIVNDIFIDAVNQGSTVILIAHNYQFAPINAKKYLMKNKQLVEIGNPYD